MKCSSHHLKENNIFCSECGELMSSSSCVNYFSALLFKENQYDINIDVLEENMLNILSKIHPDRFINASTKEQDLALKHSSYMNTAYNVLKSPIKRLQYILEINGYVINENIQQKSITNSLLMETMSWREKLDEANNDKNQCQNILDDIILMQNNYLKDAYQLLSDNNFAAAFERFMVMKFISRFKEEVLNKLKRISNIKKSKE